MTRLNLGFGLLGDVIGELHKVSTCAQNVANGRQVQSQITRSAREKRRTPLVKRAYLG